MGKVPILEKLALEFATKAHEGQKRRYTNEPYVEHVKRVAALVAKVTDDSVVIAAALLHDTVEDCKVPLFKLATMFGPKVAGLVENLTDPSTKADGNRAQRKVVDFAHTAKAHPDAQTIKLADIIDNLSGGVVEADPKFAKVYIPEKATQIKLLTKGDHKLYAQAQSLINAALYKLAA